MGTIIVLIKTHFCGFYYHEEPNPDMVANNRSILQITTSHNYKGKVVHVCQGFDTGALASDLPHHAHEYCTLVQQGTSALTLAEPCPSTAALHKPHRERSPVMD